jgi:glycosyltransferase involved in cell wall biosynthesis
MVEKISLIIPSRNDENKLFKLLRSIPNWEVVPNEIIVIDSSQKRLSIPKEFESFARKINIRLVLVHAEKLYPGHARNIGIKNSKNSFLAFLDTSTHPTKTWLSNGFNIINLNDSQGVWGKTHYQTLKYLPKIIRACTFGAKPIKTFPGTIIKKHVFMRCGLFVEAARAGEDGDWMTRAELQKINMSFPEEYLTYEALDSYSIKTLVKKWYRNYIFTADLPFFRPHKDVYYYITSFLAIIVAYNWNAVLAAWDMNSIFYIPNITKISMLLIFFTYVFARGILLPLKKGVDLKFILPINFILISMLSIVLDITKITAFIFSRFYKK